MLQALCVYLRKIVYSFIQDFGSSDPLIKLPSFKNIFRFYSFNMYWKVPYK